MTLGELIEALRKCSKTAYVQFDFPGGKMPGSLQSYRGYYECPSIDYVETFINEGDKLAHEFADELEEDLEKVHIGYKGGEFKYEKSDTPYVTQYGQTSGVKVSGVLDEGWRAVILTRYEGY